MHSSQCERNPPVYGPKPPSQPTFMCSNSCDQIPPDSTSTNIPDLMDSLTTTTFNEDGAKIMFDRFLNMDPDQAGSFENQHLVILVKKIEIGSKGMKEVSHKCRWNANKIIAIQRNPSGQLYFASQLDSFKHFFLGPTYFRHLSNVRSNIIETIKNDGNHNTDMLMFGIRIPRTVDLLKRRVI